MSVHICQEALKSLLYVLLNLSVYLSLSDKKPPKSWPSEGAIRFEKLYLRYSKADPPVLKSLNFAIEAKQKVCMCVLVSIVLGLVFT